MTQLHESGITDKAIQTAEQLRTLAAYGPVQLVTREPGYTSDKGYRPLRPDFDQRRKFRLGHQVLTISDANETVSVTVAAPDGPRDLPLQHIERVGVDHPLGHDMPLYGRQIMALVLMEWKGHQNVPRWAPRAMERFDGSHVHQVLETGIDPSKPEVGVVRAYDISTPWSARTSLETAKEADRPYGLYYVSQLGSMGAEHGLTVITSNMGYRGSDRMATVLPPKDPPMAERAVNMLDVTDPGDADVLGIHLERIERLAPEHGEAAPLTQFQADDAFLYMSRD